MSRDDPDNCLGLQTPRLGAFLSFSAVLQLRVPESADADML